MTFNIKGFASRYQWLQLPNIVSLQTCASRRRIHGVGGEAKIVPDAQRDFNDSITVLPTSAVRFTGSFQLHIPFKAPLSKPMQQWCLVRWGKQPVVCSDIRRCSCAACRWKETKEEAVAVAWPVLAVLGHGRSSSCIHSMLPRQVCGDLSRPPVPWKCHCFTCDES